MADADLGAVISIDDQTAAGARTAAQNLARLGQGMSDLSRASLGVSDSLQLVNLETGKVVFTQQALNAVGVTTTRELQNQIAAYDLLIERTKNDAAATAQLISRQQQLKNTLKGTSTGMRGASTSALDAQQAFTGFGILLRGATTGSLSSVTFGLTQLSNNLNVIKIRAERAGGSVKNILVKALKGGGGLALALLAAGLAFEIFSSKAKDSTDTVDSLIDSMLELEAVSRFRLPDLEASLSIQKDVVEAIKDATSALQVQRATMAGFTADDAARLTTLKGILSTQEELLTNIEGQVEQRKAIEGLEVSIGRVGGENVRLAEARAAAAKREAEALERAAVALLAARNNRLIDSIVGQIGLAPGVLKDVLDVLVDMKRAAEAVQNVFSRPGAGVFEAGQTGVQGLFGDIGAELIKINRAARSGLLTTFEALSEKADALRSTLREMSDSGNLIGFDFLNDKLKKTQQTILAIDIAGSFFDPFTDGLADVILGLGTVNDLLGSMKQAFASLLSLGIKGALGAGIGSLFGPGGAAAGFSLATGINPGIFGGGGGGAGGGGSGRQQLVAVVQGKDLAFVLREFNNDSSV